MRTQYGVEDMTIHRIVEQEYGFTPLFEFLPTLTKEQFEENRSWMEQGAYDAGTGNVVLCFQSYVVKTPHHTVLVDTCIGNDKNHGHRPAWHRKNDPNWMNALKAAGVGVDDIDFVMCTHLHGDHVGWNTRLDNGRWVPTFPNARYVWSKTDFDHFSALDRDPEKPAIGGAMRDSVYPIVEAGLAQMVDGTETIEEHLKLTPAPGHSPGHVLINLTSQGKQAYFSGDIIHHVIQVYHPAWNSFACADQPKARASRRMTLEKCAGSGALLLPQHFGAPHICHIDAKGEGFTPRFV